jgi:hypothetical protein
MRWGMVIAAVLGVAIVVAAVAILFIQFRNADPAVVEFILPNGWKNPVIVELDETHGAPVVVANGRATLLIGDDGHLKVRTWPLRGFHKLHVRYRDGTPLLASTSDSLQTSGIGLRPVFTRAATSKDGPQAHYVVGTEADVQAYRDAPFNPIH